MFSNKYIFIYSSVMVIVVAAILSSASQLLKPSQERNVRTEKILDILKSVNIDVDKKEAEQSYENFMVAEYAINQEGEIVGQYEKGNFIKGNVRAFDLDLKIEQRKLADTKAGKSSAEPLFPLFVCRKNDSTFFIIPMLGKGLWGSVWGNISFKEDFKTVYGVTFGHKGETPGLGAEISTDLFQDQFPGKTIFDENFQFTSIQVVKGGVATLPTDRQSHGVDAISGGTITSNGVSDMLHDCLINYVPFFKSRITEKPADVPEV